MSTIDITSIVRKHRPLIAVVGFTASGKTELGIDIAQMFGGEIVAADAVTVYKGFNIGSAKPTQKEMSKIPHHMIDICDANQGMTVAEYKRNATHTIDDILHRGRLPVLVGGSGLYVDSILYDYEFRTRPDSVLRDRLNSMSTGELLREAVAGNLDTSGVDIRNKHRLIRLIETNGEATVKRPLRDNTLVIALDVDREELRARVERRVNTMISEGLADEVMKLSQQYDWSTEAMKSIGYREWQPYFAGECDLMTVRDAIITHTMQLAKKQRTWFKRNHDIRWVNNKSESVEYVTTFMNTFMHTV